MVHRIRYIFDNEAENMFQKFVNISIGYRSVNGRYIGIGPKRATLVDLYCYAACQKPYATYR